MTEATIQIETIGSETIQIPIVGTSPLLIHRFAEKQKRAMLDAQRGQKTPKQVRDPKAEYLAALYHLKDGRPGFPATGFKQAMASSTRLFPKDVSMVLVRQTIFVHGEPGEDGQLLVAIEGEHEMREDIVTVGRGGTDLRFRPMFVEWRADLLVTYVKSAFSRGSVLTLLDAAGMGVGIGDWRPERNGDFGTFRIDETRDVEVVG